MVPKKGKNSRLSIVTKKPTLLILKMVNKSKKIKKLPGLTYHFCLLQVSEKVNSLEVNEQKDVAHSPQTDDYTHGTPIAYK